MKLKRTKSFSNLPRTRRILLVLLGITFLFGVAFSLTVRSSYEQLEAAFAQENTFTPTRLFSDLHRITPGYTYDRFLKRLKALGYPLPSSGDRTLELSLHPIDYPAEVLIPEGHPFLEAARFPLRVTFSDEKKSVLLKIESLTPEGSKEIPEIFLEPELIATLSRSDPEGKKEIRKNLKFEEIPAAMWQAIIAIEDPRFLEHPGLDPRGIARAIWVNLKSARLAQGGSTITAQLVKNLMARRTRNIALKFNELFLSLVLETKYTKEQILERYLNEIYLGQVGSLEVHGVAEGAKLFFGKDLSELRLGEFALLASLIRGPVYYSPYRHRERAIERQKLVLRKMVEAGFIAEAEAQEAMANPLIFKPPANIMNKAPYFTDYVKAEMIRQLKDKISESDIASAGFKVYTTLDIELSELAQEAVRNGVLSLEKKLGLQSATHPEERIEGALATVEHSTGYLRTLIGGRNYNESTFNRILNMKRQVGSTFKPLVYLTAFLQGQDPQGLPYSTGYPVEDAPWTLVYDSGRQKWNPRNYDKDYLSWIPLRLALVKSINTVAAKMGIQVGIPAIIETARALGIESELPEVPSLSLGVSELSPVELLTAYATIANHGIQDELTAVRVITQEDGTVFARFVFNAKQVFPKAPIDLLIESMKGVFSEGTATSAAQYGFHRPAAGKTGTTSNYRDAWFAGFTPELTTVVWVGDDQNQTVAEKSDPNEKKKKKKPLHLTGANGALPIWASFMSKALEDRPIQAFPVSDDLKLIKIDRYTGREGQLFCPSDQLIEEWVMRDHEPKGFTCESHYPESIRENTI